MSKKRLVKKFGIRSLISTGFLLGFTDCHTLHATPPSPTPYYCSNQHRAVVWHHYYGDDGCQKGCELNGGGKCAPLTDEAMPSKH